MLLLCHSIVNDNNNNTRKIVFVDIMKHGYAWDMALIYSTYIPNTCLINSKYTYTLIHVWYILIWLCVAWTQICYMICNGNRSERIFQFFKIVGQGDCSCEGYK